MLHTHGLDKFGPYFTYIKSLPSRGRKFILAFILPNYSPKTRIGPHNEDVYSALVGAILGDCFANGATTACGERTLSGGVRFIFKRSVKHQEYLFWLFDFFRTRGYCSNNLPIKLTQKLGDNFLPPYGPYGRPNAIDLIHMLFQVY